MEEYNSEVELSINTGNEETDATVEELLSSFSLEELLERTLHAVGITQPAMLTLIVTDDATIQDYNKRYRQQDKPTDVLSFPANGAKPKRSATYAGDIAISPETARRNARRFSRTLPAEMRILILHGMLHLAGFDHETDHGEMERLERRLRRQLGVV